MTSLASVWNKKANAMDTKQIQNMEGASPVASPNSWFYNADRELESLPQQSLVQSTNVHYGERPDLKSESILLVMINIWCYNTYRYTWLTSMNVYEIAGTYLIVKNQVLEFLFVDQRRWDTKLQIYVHPVWPKTCILSQ